MDAMRALSSLRFEFNIMSAKHMLVTDSKGYLFIRCYLPAGRSKRVRLDSKEISPNEKVSWNESFSMDCSGTNQSITDVVNQGTVDFELRWRSAKIPLLRSGSQVLGRGEVAWRSIFESPNMELTTWVVMRSSKNGSIKAPSIFLTMKVQVIPVVVVTKERKMKDVAKLKNKWDGSCGCSHGHCSDISCVDSEAVFIGFALDAF